MNMKMHSYGLGTLLQLAHERWITYLDVYGEPINLLPQSNSFQVSPWDAFMGEYRLTVSLRNVLIATPSSRYFQVFL